jgi:hypothetical protein
LISDTAAQTGGAAFLGSDPPRPARPLPEWQNKNLDEQCSNDSRPRDTALALALAIG